ncbi:uncharacterized protein LOC144349496 [Saccoglossus kowalevskii]
MRPVSCERMQIRAPPTTPAPTTDPGTVTTTVSQTTTEITTTVTTTEQSRDIITLPNGVVIRVGETNDTLPKTRKEELLADYSKSFRNKMRAMWTKYSNIPVEALAKIYYEVYDHNRTSTFGSRVGVEDAKRTLAFLADVIGFGNMSMNTAEIIRTTMFLNDVATTTFANLDKNDFELEGFDLPSVVRAFVKSANGVIDTRYKAKWELIKEEFIGPSVVIQSVDDFSKSIAHLLEPGQKVFVTSKNIQYHIQEAKPREFLMTGWTFISETGAKLSLDDDGCEGIFVDPSIIDDSFKDSNGISLVSAVYRHTSKQMPRHDVEDACAEQMINDVHYNVTGTLSDELISFSLTPTSGSESVPVSVIYCLENDKSMSDYNVPSCSFWDFTIKMAGRGITKDAQSWRRLLLIPNVLVITPQTLLYCCKSPT